MKYESYAEALGFTKINNIYVMESNGFQIYLKDWQYMVLTIPSFYIPLNKALDKAELKRMEVASLNNAVSAAALGSSPNTLIVTLADGIKTKEKTQHIIKEQIRIVTETLLKDGYGPMELCPVCGNKGEYSSFGDNYTPIHEECITQYKEKLEGLCKENEGFTKKHALSLLFSILGAILGILPALLCVLFLKNYFGGLLGFVPILATLGFFLGRGNSKKWMKITIGALVAILVLSFLCFAIPYMANAASLTLKDYMFTGKWLGFRKGIVGLLLCFGGFGGMKFLDKFRIDYSKELEKFN